MGLDYEFTYYFIYEVEIELDIYESFPREKSDATPNLENKLDSFDRLMNVAMQRVQFESVLTSWMARDEEWRDARARYYSCFQKQFKFDTDRLITAANMFDILPNTAFPESVAMSSDLMEAKENARISFKQLPVSPQRDSILFALKRMNENTLKHKIQHRVAMLTRVTGSKFLDIDLVVNCAVELRNHFVHGSDLKFDHRKAGVSVFLTKTLEFIFATTDLIEAGWRIQLWIDKLTVMSHPFARYKSEYVENLQKLREALFKSL